MIAELEAAVANEAMFGHFDDDDLPEKQRAEGGIIALRRAAEAIERA